MSGAVDFAALRRALDHVAADPAIWRRVCVPVFDPPPLPARMLPAEIVDALVMGGVVEVDGGLLHTRRWVTLEFGRPYFVTLDRYGRERGFIQDIWPETLALLERVKAAPPGRTADVATGCGVLAIEAALAGHQVIATDIDRGMLATAAWNADLHGVTLDLRQGHLVAPLGDETFDLLISAPHYGGPSDMLRIEYLREGAARLAPGGTLVLATFLEWDEAGVGVVESMLRPRVAAGARARVVPIIPRVKKRWFTAPAPPGPGMVSRARFLVELTPDGPPGLEVTLPPVPREVVVPLARLHGPRARRAEVRAGLDAETRGSWDRHPVATVGDADDLAALEALMDDAARGVIDVDAPVPFGLVDECRWGARPCVAAHGAIVDTAGGVRPCTRGEPIGLVGDSARAWARRMFDLRDALEERRGCVRCPAAAVCSKCVFPAVVDEAAYCELIRRHAGALAALPRLLKLWRGKLADSVGEDHLRIRTGVRTGPDEDPPLPALRAALTGAVLAISDRGARILKGGEANPISAHLAPVVETVMNGGGRDELATLGLDPGDVETTLYLLAQLL